VHTKLLKRKEEVCLNMEQKTNTNFHDYERMLEITFKSGIKLILFLFISFDPFNHR
jgi:hypothetical protein